IWTKKEKSFETVNNDKTDVESVVNRWLVDYYFFRSLDAFKKGQYRDFCRLGDVLNSVLVCPVELTDVMPTKIQVLEFLSHINEGEKLGELNVNDIFTNAFDRVVVLAASLCATFLFANCNIYWPARDGVGRDMGEKCKCSVIQRVRLEAAYKALGAATENRTFAQLEEDVETEEQERENLGLLHPADPKTGTNLDSQQEGQFLRDSGSPMEASPADQPPQTDAVPETQAGSLSNTPSVLWSGQLYTVPRLVVEPDSQVSSQCTTDCQEQGTDVRAEESPQSLATSNKKDLQCTVPDREVDIPVRKCPRRAKRAHCR
uniref:Telomeric repeat binding factor 2 n=1 Tax=Acanthochromis polyacanthus TaxID=80966 RepID=A0A3Q1H4G8_9TELE